MPGLSGQFAHPVQMGDMLLVTYSLNDIQTDLEYTDYTTYINTWRPEIISDIVDSDTFATKKTTGGDSWKEFIASWYSINNNYVGQYIVVRGNTHNGLQDIYNGSDVDGIITGSIFDNNNTIDGETYPTSPLPQIQKLTMPDGTVRSICGISPTDSNGNVRLQLKDIYVTDNNAVLGKEKADYIVSIKPEETLSSYIPSGTIRNHFTVKDVSYARFDELQEFWNEFNDTRKDLSGQIDYLSGTLSGEIVRSIAYDEALSTVLKTEKDRSTAYDEALSTVLKAEINRSINDDAFLSATFGSNATSGAAQSGEYKAIITAPVFDQLRRIYNDMTVERDKQNTISGKTDFLHELLNNKAAGIQTLEFNWQAGHQLSGNIKTTTVEINGVDVDIYEHENDDYTYDESINQKQTLPGYQTINLIFNNAEIRNSDIYVDRLVGGFYNPNTNTVIGGIRVRRNGI